MPKLKTKSGVKKRFKLTATGKIKHGVAERLHEVPRVVDGGHVQCDNQAVALANI